MQVGDNGMSEQLIIIIWFNSIKLSMNKISYCSYLLFFIIECITYTYTCTYITVNFNIWILGIDDEMMMSI